MAYHALRPCRLGGTDYRIGDEVPDAALVEGAAKRLAASGVLARAPGATVQAAQKDPELTATVTVSGEETALAITQDGMDLIVRVMTATVDNAAPQIATATDTAALALIGALESRRGVESAISARLAALAPEDPEEEAEAQEEAPEDPEDTPEAPEG